MESTDCGPACLQMICAFYGKDISQQYIKDGMSISRIGVTIRDIKVRAAELGLNCVIAKSKIEQLRNIQSPVIIHWNNNHFVILYKVQRKRDNSQSFYIADPANGKVKFSQEEFERNWFSDKDYGLIVFFKPTDAFYQSNFPKYRDNWSIALSLLKKYIPNREKVIFSVSLLIFSMICSWMIPYLYQSIIDKGLAGRNISLILKLFLTQLSFFFGYTLSSSLSSILISKVNLNIGIDYVSELLRKIMRLPMRYFDTRLNTEFIQRLEDFNRVRAFLTDNLINTFYYLVNAIVYFILLAYYSWEAVAVFTIMSILVSLWDIYFLHERKFLDYSLFRENAKNRNLLYEIINNMPDIKINNAQKTETNIWEMNQNHINKLILKQMMVNYKQNVGRSTVNRLRDIVIICYCCIISIRGNMTIGTLLSISYVLGQLGGPIEQIQALATQYQMFKVSLARLSEVQRKDEESVEENSNVQVYKLKKEIKLSNVSFKYEGSFCPYIFENLSIVFPSNRITAIVGNSGSGKSTLIKLILGFYKPQEGDVYVDRTSLKKMNIDSWRELCGVVLQDGKIFSGTIAENIAFGAKEIDITQVKNVAKIACIDDFILKQPGQYDMRIGPSGIDLSQGQKQRILIARALYKNPSLLIFDEATSSLDTVNERRIMENLEDFFKNRTVIVVAHRLSTVVNADNIIFLENGKIAEQGTHQQLVDRKGKYYELIKNQLELEC